MASTHYLDCKPKDFGLILEGKKSFDVRLNNYPYAEGDTVVFKECSGGVYTGRCLERRIVHVMSLGEVSQLVEHVGTWAGHFVVLGLTQ